MFIAITLADSILPNIMPLIGIKYLALNILSCFTMMPMKYMSIIAKEHISAIHMGVNIRLNGSLVRRIMV